MQLLDNYFLRVGESLTAGEKFNFADQQTGIHFDW